MTLLPIVNTVTYYHFIKPSSPFLTFLYQRKTQKTVFIVFTAPPPLYTWRMIDFWRIDTWVGMTSFPLLKAADKNLGESFAGGTW